MAGVVVDSSNDKTFSVEPQQDNVGVDNPTIPTVKNQKGTRNVDMLHNEHDSGQK